MCDFFQAFKANPKDTVCLTQCIYLGRRCHNQTSGTLTEQMWGAIFENGLYIWVPGKYMCIPYTEATQNYFNISISCQFDFMNYQISPYITSAPPISSHSCFRFPRNLPWGFCASQISSCVVWRFFKHMGSFRVGHPISAELLMPSKLWIFWGCQQGHGLLYNTMAFLKGETSHFLLGGVWAKSAVFWFKVKV